MQSSYDVHEHQEFLCNSFLKSHEKEITCLLKIHYKDIDKKVLILIDDLARYISIKEN